MGKMFDTLRQSVAGQRPAAPATPEPAPEEMPFIEIGPDRKVFAASADVMAASPRPAITSQPGGVVFRSATPLPGTVPTLRRPRFAAELLAYHAPMHAGATRYRELYSAVREAVAAKAVVDQFVLLFTGVRPGIGSTTCLLNVAITAARQDCRTLVIDANLRRPAVAARVGLEATPGLTDVLAADCSLEEAIRPTDQDNLFVLPAGEPQPLFADTRTLHDLVASLREQFDYVLVDGPAWDGKPLVASLASGSDAVFLLVPTAEADTPPTSDLVRDLPRQGVRLAGSILIA